eukprot:PhM_4_TR1734/c0_g1_i7/m.86876
MGSAATQISLSRASGHGGTTTCALHPLHRRVNDALGRTLEEGYAQKRNKDECKSVLESFGTNIVANYLHDQSRVLLSGFTEDTKTFATACGRQSWPLYLDVLRDVDLMPGSQYGAFVQRIVLHLHDTFTEDNIVTWFRDNAVALRKAKVNSSDLVQQGRQCCEGVHG